MFKHLKILIENIHYTRTACITIDSVMKIAKKNSSAGLFKRVQIIKKYECLDL